MSAGQRLVATLRLLRPLRSDFGGQQRILQSRAISHFRCLQSPVSADNIVSSKFPGVHLLRTNNNAINLTIPTPTRCINQGRAPLRLHLEGRPGVYAGRGGAVQRGDGRGAHLQAVGGRHPQAGVGPARPTGGEEGRRGRAHDAQLPRVPAGDERVRRPRSHHHHGQSDLHGGRAQEADGGERSQSGRHPRGERGKGQGGHR